MATNKNKKPDNTPDSSAKTPTTESQTPSTPAKAESEATTKASTPSESKPTIEPEVAKSATAQKVSSTEPTKASTEQPPAPEAKPAEKPPEPTVQPAAAKASQPPAPAQPKPPAPAATGSQPAYTPPVAPVKPVVAPPPDSPVSATVSSSQPTIVQPDVEVYSTDSTDTTFQEIKAKVVTFLENLPENTANFFKQNQKPLISLGLILALLITIKITAGLLDILNEIPLVKPLFEAVGVTYAGWFIYRYLLWSSTRQELWQKLDSAKEDILGEKPKAS